jgi:hypothetical protein
MKKDKCYVSLYLPTQHLPDQQVAASSPGRRQWVSRQI